MTVFSVESTMSLCWHVARADVKRVNMCCFKYAHACHNQKWQGQGTMMRCGLQEMIASKWELLGMLQLITCTDFWTKQYLDMGSWTDCRFRSTSWESAISCQKIPRIILGTDGIFCKLRHAINVKSDGQDDIFIKNST